MYFYGRKLRLMWHFRNDERELSYDPLKKKSKFDPKRKDAAIELYLSRLEEEISSLDYKVGYFNLTKGERNVIYSLKDDNFIKIKDADKGSAVVVWERDDYLREAKNQLNDKNVYKELTRDVEGHLEKIIKTVLKKVRGRRDISDSTLDCFLVNNPKLGRSYLLPKIHRGFRMCQDDLLYRIESIIRKTFQSFLNFILKFWHKKLNLILKILMIFLGKQIVSPSAR